MLKIKGIFLFLFLFTSVSSVAQTPVKSLYDDSIEINGAYYKDIYNDLDRFGGIWKSQGDNFVLEIVLTKNHT